jgi:predicted transcriptional regulator YheO
MSSKDYKQALSVARAATALFGPELELIIYDHEDDQVVVVENEASGVRHGDKLSYIAGNLPENGEPEVFNQLLNAKRFKTVTTKISSKYALIYNFDTTKYEKILGETEKLLSNLLARKSTNSNSNYKNPDEQIIDFVNDYRVENQLVDKKLSKFDRTNIIKGLQDIDAFKYRNSVAVAAGAMSISVASVYNYLRNH